MANKNMKKHQNPNKSIPAKGGNRKFIAPVKASANKSPVNKSPVNKAPVNKAPVNKAPVNKAPVNKAPFNKVPVNNKSKVNNKTAVNKKNSFNNKMSNKKPVVVHEEEDLSEEESDDLPSGVEEITSDMENHMSSDDDMSEEEMKKMLGNSDGESEPEDESDEEIVVKEAKVNLKRKMQNDDEPIAKKIKSENDDIDDIEISDDEDEEDDDDYEDDSMIDDEEEGDSDENEEPSFDEEESAETLKEKTVKKEEVEESDEEDNDESDEEVKAESDEENAESDEEDAGSDDDTKMEVEEVKTKLKKEIKEPSKKVDVSHLFVDMEGIESETMRQEIEKRLISRLEKTLIVINVPNNFNNSVIAETFPKRVACIIPYNTLRHKNAGQAYITFSSKEEVNKAVEIAKGKKLKAFPQDKTVTDVDMFNCRRLVINNIKSNTTIENLKSILPNANNVEFLPVKTIDRKMTRIAFAEYDNVEDAINDYDSKHGVVCDGHPLNVKFHMKNNPARVPKKMRMNQKIIIAMGVKKQNTKEKIKALFPQAKEIIYFEAKGLVKMHYETEEEGKVDYDNAMTKKPNNLKIYFDSSLDVGEVKSLRAKLEKKVDNGKNNNNKNASFKKSSIKQKPNLKKNFKPTKTFNKRNDSDLSNGVLTVKETVQNQALKISTIKPIENKEIAKNNETEQSKKTVKQMDESNTQSKEHDKSSVNVVKAAVTSSATQNTNDPFAGLSKNQRKKLKKKMRLQSETGQNPSNISQQSKPNLPKMEKSKEIPKQTELNKSSQNKQISKNQDKQTKVSQQSDLQINQSKNIAKPLQQAEKKDVKQDNSKGNSMNSPNKPTSKAPAIQEELKSKSNNSINVDSSNKTGTNIVNKFKSNQAKNTKADSTKKSVNPFNRSKNQVNKKQVKKMKFKH